MAPHSHPGNFTLDLSVIGNPIPKQSMHTCDTNHSDRYTAARICVYSPCIGTQIG